MSTSCSTLGAAIETLRQGGIVSFPTESSYGLAVDPRNERALATLSTLKGREASAPFALIAGDFAQARQVTSQWTAVTERLVAEHWPGALTVIMQPAMEVSSACLGPSGGVGVRVSSVALARDLALGFGYAITATSANPSGRPPATTELEVRHYFGDSVDFYLEGGTCAGMPSTLVDFDSSSKILVLRQGPVQVA